MNPERFQRLQELFRLARGLPADEREAALREACPDDDGLRRDVLDLLREDADDAGPLDAPAFGTRVDVATPYDDQVADVAFAPGTRIGPYEIVRAIGEGGFGRVFEAQQSEPVERRVALKVIKLGMDTRQVIARFEAERHTLARMDHPHIATVLDAGATDGGRPYFVMELCRGDAITDYCDRHQLTIDERLELFGQVCRAVEHAHQKGIIHRDLKPSNVLVEEQDGRPFARVIDFGIAKATDVEQQRRSVFTRQGQIIGTPEYMSPEQAAGADDVDTRTDVYALGVLLYELLTGATPLERDRLRGAAFAELVRIIREVEPPTPSTRLGRDPETSTGVAEARRTDIRRLRPRLRGELDWIVMRALAKERDRRYGSAGALERDLANHRVGMPVVAAPPSRAYLARTFVRRHRVAVTTGALVAAALLLAVIGTSFGLLRAIDEAERADASATEARDEAVRADEAARAAETARAEADRRAEELETVARFQAARLADVVPSEMGAGIRASILERVPDAERDALDASLEPVNFTDIAMASLQADFLDRTIEAIDTEFADQPAIRARLLHSVGETSLQLGLLEVAATTTDAALALYTDTLGPEHDETLESLHLKTRILLDTGRYADALEPAETLMEARKRLAGPDDTETYNAVGLYGAVLRWNARPAEAEPYYLEAFEGQQRVLGPDDPSTLVAMSNLGSLMRALGRLEESAEYYGEVLERRLRTLGPDDPATLYSMLAMGGALRRGPNPESAEPYYLDALAGMRRLHGERHPDTIQARNNLSVFYQQFERWDDAAEHARTAFESAAEVLGPDHRSTLIYEHNYGGLLMKLGRFDEAEPYLLHALETAMATFGPRHRDTISFSIRRAQFLLDRDGDLEAVRAIVDRIEGPAQEVFPPSSRFLRAIAELRSTVDGDGDGDGGDDRAGADAEDDTGRPPAADG